MSAALQNLPTDDLYFVRKSGTTGALPELSRVALLQEVASEDGSPLPIGLTGTIVGVWGGGEAYEVEFTDPIEALVTVSAKAVRPV